MRVLELEACPACGADDGRLFDYCQVATLRRCERCGVVSAVDYADPAEVYVDGYMFGEVGPFGLDVRHPHFQRYLIRVAHRRIEIIERATGLRAADLLDVGSGTGEVLLAARDRGWRVRGVEPERTAAEMARGRGLEVTVSKLEDSGLPRRSFDVVSAFHVLEHMPDSRAFLMTLARFARPGGHVVVEVPNWDSVQRRRRRERWEGLRPREHLVHFTPQTLRETFVAAGIAPLAVRSPAYVGPPQDVDQALWDLARPFGRLRKLLRPLTRAAAGGQAPAAAGGQAPGAAGGQARYPTRAGWMALRLVEAVYDLAGVGTVALCVGRVGTAGHRDGDGDR